MGEDGPVRGADPPIRLIYQLHNLRAFLFAAAAQSIVGAARQLFRTPPAITRSVAELEAALGVRLFERSARGILLNRYGGIVLARASRIEAELRQAASELTRPKPKSAAPSPSAIEHLLFNGRKLELIVRLVDSGKVSSAAAQMAMTQAGASMALARIEAAIGAPLFERGKKGIAPMEVTSRLVMRAKRVFAEFRHLTSDISAESGTLQGSVVIGTPPLGRTYTIPTAIAAVLSNHPNVQVTMMATSFDLLLSGLRSGEVDAIIGVPRDESDLEGLTIEPLFTDRLIVIARAGHPLAGRDSVGLADLLGWRWILPWSSSTSRKLFEACFRSARMRAPPASVESADLATIRQLLATSDMLAVASARQMMFELQSGLFDELPVPLTGMTREVGLIWRDGAMLSPTANALLAAIRTQAAQEVAEASTSPLRRGRQGHN